MVMLIEGVSSSSLFRPDALRTIEGQMVEDENAESIGIRVIIESVQRAVAAGAR